MGLESKVIEDSQKETDTAIDREKTCPLLLRVFCNTNGRHNRASDFGRNVPTNELQIYTWMDATLKELTRLITEVYTNTRTKGTEFQFATVYPLRGQFRLKDIGRTIIGTKGPDDNSTLKSKRFVIGDYIDVAITVARGGRESRGGGGAGGGGGGGGGGGESRDNRRSPYDRRSGGGGGGGASGGRGHSGHDYR